MSDNRDDDPQLEIRPATAMSESFRRTLKQNVIAEALRASGDATTSAGAGTCDLHSDLVEHVAVVTDPWTGVTSAAADVEPVDDDTVLRNARFVTGALAREQEHAHRDDQR